MRVHVQVQTFTMIVNAAVQYVSACRSADVHNDSKCSSAVCECSADVHNDSECSSEVWE